MDSSASPVVPADCRKDTNSTVVVDDTSFPAADAKSQKSETEAKPADRSGKPAKDKAKGSKAKKHRHTKKKPGKKARSTEASDSSSSEDEAHGATASDSDLTDSGSDTDQEPRKRKSRSSKKRTEASGVRVKHPRHSEKKPKEPVSDSDSDSDSESDTSGSEAGNEDRSATKKGKIGKHFKALELQISQLQNQLAMSQLDYGSQLYAPAVGYPSSIGFGNVMPPTSTINPARLSLNSPPPIAARGRSFRGGLMRGQSGRATLSLDPETEGEGKISKVTDKKKPKSGRPEYKRVDWVWDSSLFSYKLQDTNEAKEDAQYSGYIFHIRRTFDCEGRYRQTFVDIKSKLLRECLQDVIGNVKGVSLVDETPKLDPNLLFLYLEEFRAHLMHLKQAKPAGDEKHERKKNQKRLDNKRKQLKVLIKYLDTDYAKIKESLYPMLSSGLITFELLWALWKPNTLAYSSTYGCHEEARVWKVEIAERHHTIMKGDVYFVEGKYTEFDGKKFGYGTLFEDIPEFQGARKITSLPFYPLSYHKNEAQIRKDLVERGKKFVTLSGVHYKSYAGMAFLKRKKNQVVKFNIQQSRIMVDPAIFRRINPNYSVSVVRPKDHDVLSDDELSDDGNNGCGCDTDDTDDDGDGDGRKKRPQFVTKLVKDTKGRVHMVSIPEDELESQDQVALHSLPVKDEAEGSKLPNGEAKSEGEKQNSKSEEKDEESLPELTDEDYLIASPVVLGFAFSEKQWLEFTVSGIKDIKWNDKAWDSLVLEPKTKDLIQALVKSRKFNAAQTIDDVIQGKGKGLVTVLHGPPGTGKTLTAEGISELLQCPLYMASAGELGTDSRFLEAELQKILDVCHAWGAILLLDEADVFLEKRNMHDIHRNALVSIFLRQLEYFQGILFLTTNRVETFDEAFQSRIHIALKYDVLDAKAKKVIFKMFIERVRALGKLDLKTFTEEDFNALAQHELNGREIKNVVGSAQDLAVNRNEALSMQHIRQVLDVHDKFGRDLRGGGYEEAMRSYF